MSRKLVVLCCLVIAAVSVALVVPASAQESTPAAGDTVILNGDSYVIEADIQASNGVIHIINKVLLPPSMMATQEAMMGTESAMMGADSMMGTESAMMGNDSMMGADSMMGTESAMMGNDSMMGTESAMMGTAEATSMADQDIVTILSGRSDTSTLVAAVKAADLVSTLQGPGPFTVFAPNNDAFAAIMSSMSMTPEQALGPDNKANLTSILTYHVVPGKILAADLMGMTTLSTVNGEPITVTTGPMMMSTMEPMMTAEPMMTMEATAAS